MLGRRSVTGIFLATQHKDAVKDVPFRQFSCGKAVQLSASSCVTKKAVARCVKATSWTLNIIASNIRTLRTPSSGDRKLRDAGGGFSACPYGAQM